MFDTFTVLSEQNSFPREDLSDANAEILELMMANTDIRETAHTVAERQSWIFRIGHAAISRSIGRQYDAQSALAASNAGVVTFEAITSLVDGMHRSGDMRPANKTFLTLANADDSGLSQYIDNALESFLSDMPNTKEVVTNSTRRTHGPLVSYAVLGAAMSRRFGLDSVS